MKQRLLTLLCLLCCLSASTAWADTYSHEITQKTWSKYGEQTLSNVKWTASATGGDYLGYDGTKGQQFGSGSSPASSLTLSTSGFADKILSVKVYTSGAKDIAANLSLTVGDTTFKCNNLESVSITATNTEYNFTGDATGEIVINWEQTSSKALYLKKIEVVYGSEQPKSAPAFTTQPIGTEYDKDAVATPLSVEVSGYPIPTLQWYSNSAASVEGATAIEGATGKTYTPATATVGTTYYYCVAQNSEGSATSDIVSVVVNEVTLDGTGEGTAESPFDVKRALDYINKGFDSTVDLYVKGIISEVKGVYLNYGNATYLISFDGETTSSQLTIFRGNYLNNAAFTSEDQIQASDSVVIVGKLIKYDDKTSEMAQGNYIVSHMRDGKITPTLSFSPEEVTAYLDELDEFKAPVLATDPEGLKVKYTISDEEVATIDDDGTLHFNAAGTATVTATADDEAYGDAEATYTLKVVANKPVFVMLVAKAQNGKYYAMSSETGVGKNSLKAVEINVDNYEAMKDDSNLLWNINVVNNTATICNEGNGQYLAAGSNTDLKTQTGTYDWTWDDSHQYGSVETGTTTKTKRTYLGIVDGNDAYFKNYAESNLGNGSYFTTLTMPDFINKLRKVDVETLDKNHINVYVESGSTNVSKEVQLLDGISINVEDNVSVEKLVYNRTFTATQANTWQPLFVPFTINTAELPEGAIVAEMVKVTFAADDDDNVTYTLVWKPATGELAANKPYIMHLGSEEAVANFDFVSKNAELQTTECTEQAVLSFTTEDNTKFEFWGTYGPITNMKTAFGGNSYVLSSGQFVHPKDNVVLKPFRYYLLFKPNASGKSNMIIKNVINDETEGIEEITIEDASDNVYIDLMGRRIENPTTGIYIHNGKKVFVK